MRISTLYQFQRQSSFINKQYEQMAKLEYQSSTQMKLQHSSDDPVLAGQIKSVQNYLNSIDTYTANVKYATDRAETIGRQMGVAIESVSKLKTLISQSLTGTTTKPAEISSQLKGLLTGLLSVANSKDAATNGYIFSGVNTLTPPYALVNGSYQYQGSMAPSYIQLGENTSTIFNESGFNVFGDILQGNGTFTVTAGAGNTGGAITDMGSANQSTYVPDTYTITFVTNASGKLAYTVTGATSGQVIPASPAPIPANAPDYVPGAPIPFNGITLTIDDGSNPPKVGDTFTVAPATKQNVFNSIQSLINDLDNPNISPSYLQQALAQAGAHMDQIASHFIAYQSEAGARAGTVATQKGINEGLIQTQAVLLNNLQHADPAETMSLYLLKQQTLSTAMDSYKLFMKTMSEILKL